MDGPEDAEVPVSEVSEVSVSGVAARQDALGADLEAALAFGEARPAAYGGVWFDGPRLHVGLTALEHAPALRDLLVHPDDVDVVLVPRSHAELQQLRTRLEARLERDPDAWTGLGDVVQQVSVDLEAWAVDLAAELHAEHGEALRITVGGTAWPPVRRPSATRDRGPVATARRPELRLEALPDARVVRRGRGLRGVVRVTNTGEREAHVSTDRPLVGCLVGADGGVAGSFTGWIAGTGLELRLAPGGSADVDFLAGTSDPESYATPPGSYSLVVVLPLYADGAGRQGQLVTAPVEVMVTGPS